MRHILVAVSTAAALIAGTFVLGPNRAEAMVTAPQLDRAEQSISPIEKTACWRSGWRGWGWYPCGYYGDRDGVMVPITDGDGVTAGAVGVGTTVGNRPAVVRRVPLHRWGGTYVS